MELNQIGPLFCRVSPRAPVLDLCYSRCTLMILQKVLTRNKDFFSDDCVCYREIKDTEDTVILQGDIDRLGCWTRSLGMRFEPVKCNIMQITRE